MTKDDLHQVIYKCETCGATKALDDTSLKRISDEFKRLGWTNTPKPIGDKIEYIVHCPECVESDWREWLNVQETQDDFLTGTGR